MERASGYAISRLDCPGFDDRLLEPGAVQVAWYGGGALGVHPPIAMPATLAQQACTVLRQMSFEVSSLHAATMLSDSLPTDLP
jgi:hypothetical protein